jgi:hypothetical protein
MSPGPSRPVEGLPEERESQRLATRPITLIGVGTGAALLLSLGALLLFFRMLAGDPRQGFPATERFPQPRLQSDPAADLRALQARQGAQLEGYAWVDRDRGLVRVPVERAMEVIAGRGSGAYGPLEPPP